MFTTRGDNMQRRDFLRTGVSAAVAVSLPGVALTYAQRAEAAVVSANLVVEQVDRVLSAGPPPVTVPTWQFGNAVSTPGSGGVYQLTVLAGDEVTINLQNNLAVAVNFVIPGILDTSPPAQPGSLQTYTFTAPAAPGTYLVYDDVNGPVSRAMGLGAALLVLPADGATSLYPGGPLYNRDHLLVFSELDTRLNRAVAAGGAFDIAKYEPNYFFVNGIFYRGGRGVEIQFAQRENVAIRMVNAGLIYYPMHFHGWHVNVATRNRAIEPAIVEKDSVLVKTDECVEVMLSVGTQVGTYPLHTHYLPALTNNGLYLGGAMIMMVSA